ncbi:hypothetical protein [Flavobacterium cerinum]|uniref:DoxX family protein n=1 Tax=Flavobacterium cerinum TaxID=2502784 RepID=A0ABY5INL5_9FLAO|nr:hypothetical protein [Flavobacterium cerinum]UUC44219.1 hypothetical protein NOX80_11310 [Flavobacterium cerinum]
MKPKAFKIVNILLIMLVVAQNVWDGYRMLENPTQSFYGTELGEHTVFMGVLSVCCAVFILFPFTYITGNLLTVFKMAVLILFMLKMGEVAAAFWEVPFLLIPVVLARCCHPFSNRYQWDDMMLERKTG